MGRISQILDTAFLLARLSIFHHATCLATAAASLTALVLYVDASYGIIDRSDDFFNSTTYGGLVSMSAFLTVFRTSQAYARYWEGSNLVHRMMGNWVDAVSTAFAYTRHSEQEEVRILEFKHILVRLVSLLNAMVLGELEGMNTNSSVSDHLVRVMGQKRYFEYELLDAGSLDPRTLGPLGRTKNGPILVHHWVQELIVEAIGTGVMSIPAPLLSAVFQELGRGMVMYQEGIQLARVKFPFPYTMTSSIMLAIISVMTPVVFCTWTTGFVWPILCTFFLIFAFWALHFTAGELENPFGDDANDLDMRQIHRDLNTRLLTILKEGSSPLPTLGVPVGTAAHNLQHLTTKPHSLCDFETAICRRKSWSEESSGSDPGHTFISRIMRMPAKRGSHSHRRRKSSDFETLQRRDALFPRAMATDSQDCGHIPFEVMRSAITEDGPVNETGSSVPSSSTLSPDSSGDIRPQMADPATGSTAPNNAVDEASGIRLVDLESTQRVDI